METIMHITRLVLVATLATLLMVAAFAPAEAQTDQTFRFQVNFQTDLTNYLQASEYLDPIHTMVGIPNGPFPSVCGTPLCDPAFVGWYRDLYTVGVIDGIEVALAAFKPGNIARCGDNISKIADLAATRILQLDPALRGSRGAAPIIAQAAIDSGCTVGP
jgi:hypothetical protein